VSSIVPQGSSVSERVRQWARRPVRLARHLIAIRRIAVNWPSWALRRVLISLVRVPCVVITRGGSKFHLGGDPMDDLILIGLGDIYEASYFPELPEPFADGSLVVDVGAHHGFYTVEALCRYPGARMIAVEPDPAGCRIIDEQLAVNGLQERAEIVEGCLGREAGSVFLEFDPEASTANRTVPLDGAHAPGDKAGTVVRVVPVEDVLKGRMPYLVKCNAQGAEFELFPLLFSRGIFPKVVVLEAHPEYGLMPDLLRTFEEAGYENRPTRLSARIPRFCFWRRTVKRNRSGSTGDATA
jgi:FkbM family methyltransferase